MPPSEPPLPWRSFLAAWDARLSRTLNLHCIGGFAVSVVFGAPRTTADLDVLPLIGADAAELTPATRDGELHRRFHVYVDPVGVVVPPLDYEMIAELHNRG